MKKLLRSILFAFAFFASYAAQAGDYVIIYTNNGTTYYLGMNGNNLQAKIQFDPSCIWVSSRTNLDGTSSSLQNKQNTARYLSTTCTRNGINNYTWSALTASTTANVQWRGNNGNVYAYASGTVWGVNWNRSASIGNGGNITTMRDDNATGSQFYAVTTTPNALQDNTTAPAISIATADASGVQFTHSDISGTFLPANSYTTYTFNNNSINWYDDANHGSNTPAATDVSTLIPTYTWSIASGSGVSISSDGLLTVTATPSATVTVRLTTSNIAPLPNKTANYTLTVTTVAALDETVAGEMSVSPASVLLDLGELATVTASASISQTHRTRIEYRTISDEASQPLLYYYGGAMQAAEPQAAEDNTPLAFHHFNWSNTDGGTSYFAIDPNYSNSQNTMTLTRNATPSTAANVYTVSVSGFYGPSQVEKTATVMVSVPPTYVDLAGISCEGLTLTYGTSGTLNPNTWINGEGAKYVNLTYASANESVATVADDGTVQAVGVGTTTVTVQSIRRDGSNGPSVDVTITVTPATLNAPTITVDGSGTVTIVDANSPSDGATIYYTTDGSDPTTSGTHYTAPFTVTNETTVKAVARGDANHSNSSVATQIYAVTGVVSTTVYLNDLEDHKWSYYNDPDCPIRSLNPADVKITYYGNGQTENNMTTTDTKDIPTSFGAKATGVQVSATETGNTFVYYKTLERTNGEGAASKAAADGAAMYTTIPNPFQVRPTGQNNGSQTITPSARTIVVVTSRSENNTSAFDENGTLTVSYGTFSQVISGRTTTTISGVPVGTTVSLVFDGSTSSTNRKNRCRVTVYYETASGATAVATYNPNNTPNNSFTVAAPASQTVSFGTYRGFYAWRVKSKSASITSITDADGNAFANDIIPAETDIRINTTSEYGNEIEFEALWAQAYATTGSTDLPYAVSSSVSSAYERNFHILNASTAASNFQKGYPCTVIGRAPNSTTLNATRAVTGGFTAAAATKFEELNITDATGSFWTANNHDLIVGRGCTGTVNNVRGMGGNTSTTLDYTIRLESGVFNYVAFIAGIAGGTASGEMTLSGTNNHVTGVLGCDYDRAVEKSTTNYNYTTAPLRVTNSMSLGAQPKLTNQTESEIFNVTVKSGYFGSGNSISDGGAARSFYIGLANEYNTGKRKLTIEGGRFNLSIAGGIDVGNTSDNAVIVRMKGGEVAGSIYGAAAWAAAAGGRRFIFTGGTVGGWIAGGCNGTSTDGGKLEGKTFIYFGGTAQCNSNGINTTIGPGNATGGNIFGAGSGNASSGPTATVGEVDQSTIVIADQSMVERNVYGGGNYGYVAGTGNTNKSDIYILGGDVKGSVFGGANMQKGNIVNITMKDGLVENGIYGGSNTRGDIAGNVTIQVDGGTVGQGNAGNGIFGGGYGQTTSVDGNVSVTLGTCAAGDVTVYGDVYGGSALGAVNNAASDKTTVSLYNGTIYGGLYGGGYGPGGVAANVNGAVAVKVYGGSVLCSTSDPSGEAGSGSVFGCNNAGGAPQSTVTVDIYNTDQPASGYALHAVYGGGNKAAYNNTPVVTIHGCSNSIEYVYGGGNATDVLGTNVTIWGGTIGSAFGGGNGAGAGNPGANITAEGTNLVIHGGTIGSVFGGSNEKGKISSSVNVTISGAPEPGEDPCTHTAYTECPMEINEMYSGGNKAELRDMGNNWIAPGNINVTTDCSTKINYLFGGARMADYGGGDITLTVNGGVYKQIFGGNNLDGEISGNVTVNFLGGKAEDIFGGNNMGGTVRGTITVNIDSTANSCDPDFYVENVYGGGNQAEYSHAAGNYPEVNVKNGTVQQDVYGGGLGAGATVTGSPKVTVGVSDTGKRALVLGNVFGGGNAASVSGNTRVNIMYNTYIKGNVYGGGNAATVNGNTKVVVGQ